MASPRRVSLSRGSTGPPSRPERALRDRYTSSRRPRRKFEQALVLAQGLRIEALSDDGVVVPGQPVALTVILANRGAGAMTLRDASTAGFTDSHLTCAVGAVAPGGDREVSGTGRSSPADARGPANRTGIGRARRAATRSTPTRRSACRTVRRRSSRAGPRVGGAPVTVERRSSTATKATSSAARSGWSCWSCRRSRSVSRRRRRSSRRRSARAAADERRESPHRRPLVADRCRSR